MEWIKNIEQVQRYFLPNDTLKILIHKYTYTKEPTYIYDICVRQLTND